MTINAQALTRVFRYSGMELTDPGAHMTPTQVRDLYSASFPEINAAEIEGPTVEGDKLVYEFRRSAGAKG